MCAPQRLRSAWASVSLISVRCPYEETLVLSYPLSAQRRLIRLGGCLGWSESSLGAQVILLVLSGGGSMFYKTGGRFDLALLVSEGRPECLLNVRFTYFHIGRFHSSVFWPFDSHSYRFWKLSESSKYPAEGFEEMRSRDWIQRQIDRI